MSFLASVVWSEPSDLTNPADWLRASFGVGPSAAGVRVTPASALSLSQYWGAIRNISQDTANLPISLLRKTSDGGRERVDDHAAIELLRVAPNAYNTPFVLRQLLMAQALGYGNGYWEIERDINGHPVGLHHLHPSRVVPCRNEQGLLVYDVYPEPNQARARVKSREVRRLRAFQVLHVRGMGDEIEGYSILKLAADSLGLGIALQTFAASFFANGARPAGVLQAPGRLGPDAAKSLKTSFEQAHVGVGKTGGTVVLEEGITWTAQSVPPEEAQFLETRKFAVEEVARWFRIPVPMLQDLSRATWANLESLRLEYVDFCLTPWLTHIEQELAAKLLTDQERRAGYYFRHNLDALLRGDSTTRFSNYQKGIAGGFMTPNEARAKEDWAPGGEGADKLYMQGAMAPQELVAAGKTTTTAPSRSAREDDDRIGAALRPVFMAEAVRSRNKFEKKGERFASGPDPAAALAAYLPDHRAYVIELFMEPMRAYQSVMVAYGHAVETHAADALKLAATDAAIQLGAEALADHMIDAASKSITRRIQ